MRAEWNAVHVCQGWVYARDILIHYLGMMPAEVAGKTRVSAVELDPTTASICKLLYPAAAVHNEGFEKHAARDNF